MPAPSKTGNCVDNVTRDFGIRAVPMWPDTINRHTTMEVQGIILQGIRVFTLMGGHVFTVAYHADFHDFIRERKRIYPTWFAIGNEPLMTEEFRKELLTWEYLTKVNLEAVAETFKDKIKLHIRRDGCSIPAID